jgi:AraC-like DNA-binding protein
MKVVAFNVPQTTREALRVQEDLLPHFYDKLHQHPETQIMLILQGEGTLIAGDYVGRFTVGDLYLIGSNQAHVFRNDEVYYHNKSKLKAHALSLYFDEQYAGEAFWQLKELQAAKDFLKSTTRGYKIYGTDKEKITQLVYTIQKQEGLDRLITFLSILKILSQSHDLQALSIAASGKAYSHTEEKRMNDVLQFTFRESQREIFLDEVAQVANLSNEAFCRYFKTRTRKSYINFLNEVRISKACQLLISNQLSIQQICYEVGFNNLSHFNRVFKKVTGRTPSNFLIQ